MNVTIGDLAQSLVLRRHGSELRSTLGRLTTELSTGQSNDLAGRFGRDFTIYASVDRSLETASAYQRTARETAAFADTMQIALQYVQSSVEQTYPELLSAVESGNLYLLGSPGVDASGRLAAMLHTLNVRAADRSVFSGLATEKTPFPTADAILDALETAVAGAASAEDVRDTVAAWFDTPGGGFETLGYLGSDTPLSAIRLSDRAEVSLSVTGDAPELRDAMKGFAMAALIDRNVLAGDVDAQIELGRYAAEHLISASAGIVSLRAGIGATQGRIEELRVETAAETAALEIARSDLVSVDPYETAVELEAVETQLTTLYTLTARLSGLSLVNFLR